MNSSLYDALPNNNIYQAMVWMDNDLFDIISERGLRWADLDVYQLGGRVRWPLGPTFLVYRIDDRDNSGAWYVLHNKNFQEQDSVGVLEAGLIRFRFALPERLRL